VLSLLWLLFATVAAVIIARLAAVPTSGAASRVSEVLKIWLILTLVVAGSLMGWNEPLMEIRADQYPALPTVR
jgi:hypothetical protein